MAFSTSVATNNVNQQKLIRTEVWSTRIQEELQEALMAQSLVEMITDFPDGNQVHIPTLGSLTALDYTENAQINLQDPTVGEFLLTIDKYKQSGIAITDKMKQDAFYMEVLNSKFPMMCVRALLENLEKDIFLLHKKQTTNNANTINGEAHRFVASGASTTITVDDFAKAKLSLDKANVSKVGRRAFVSSKVVYQLSKLDAVYRQDYYGDNSVIKDAFGTTEYVGKYMGFDVFQSNLLDEATGLDHSIAGTQTANLFVGPEAFIGAMRLMPEVEESRDWEFKRDVYHVTTRYGLGLYRATDLVTILTAS